jgi:hypothetical protein
VTKIAWNLPVFTINPVFCFEIQYRWGGGGGELHCIGGAGGLMLAICLIFPLLFSAACKGPTHLPARPVELPEQTLKDLGQRGLQNPEHVCDPNSFRRAQSVTHYYIPLLQKFDKNICNKSEGVCRYFVQGVEYLANVGRQPEPIATAICKNGYGYGPGINCLNPCRTLAAHRGSHPAGEVLFFPDLVGKHCGSGKNATVSDGFLVVQDDGSPTEFKDEGRFDLFWGDCQYFESGTCRDPGAQEISKLLTNASYCKVWTPEDPRRNAAVKNTLVRTVRAEAWTRGDSGAATNFDLDFWVGNTRVAQAPRIR